MNQSQGLDLSESTIAERVALARWEGEGGRALREELSSATSAAEQGHALKGASGPLPRADT